jgi:hypothetical protein
VKPAPTYRFLKIKFWTFICYQNLKFFNILKLKKMSLIDLITGNAGTQVAAQAENKFGISKNQVIALMAVAAPLVISYLRKKSQENDQEAEALNSALEKDHDGSILNNPEQAAERQQEGN